MYLKFTWRIVAFLALFVYTLLAFVAISLLIHNIWLVVALGLTVALLAYVALALIIMREKHQWAVYTATAIGLASLVAELSYLLMDKSNRRALIAMLILSAAYLGLSAVLRNKYRQEVQSMSKPNGKTAHFQRPYLIINPKSGNGRAIKAHIAEIAQQQGIRVLLVGKDVSVANAANQAVRAGADVLGISGGDGSIGAVAKAAIARELPIVVLPGGTRCHFARDLGLEPDRITDALSGFTGVERQIDVADINGRIFLNNASFGLYADIVDHPDYREHKMEVIRDTLGSMALGAKAPYDLRFRHGKLYVRRAVQVLVGVNRYNMINIFELGHRGNLDEGVLQVTAITQADAIMTKHFLKPMSMSRLERYWNDLGVYQWVGKKFRIANSSKKIVVGVDGEREEYASPVIIRILPRALRVFVPVEVAHGRPKNPLSLAAVQNAWRAVTHPALW